MTVSSGGIDAVLQAPPPAFAPAQACEIGRAAFGIEARGARSLGSERDQAFLLTGRDGSGVAVLKVSNPAEDPAMLDMEALAAFHAVRCDPGLTVALPRLPGGDSERPGVRRRRRDARSGCGGSTRALATGYGRTTCCPGAPGWSRSRWPIRR